MENKTNSPPILGIPKPQHDMLSLSITVSTRMAPSAFLPAVFLSRATTILRNSLKRLFSFVIFRDYIISLFFRYCGLSPTAVRLDGQTSLALWRPARHRKGRPTLVLVHGFGGNAKWQWVHQIRALTDSFNVYVPDLIFFGDSVSDSDERSVEFQARCVAEGLKRVGLRRYSVSGISYGGFVAYWMAVALGEEVVEKVVILTAGICATEEEREEMKRRKVDGRDIVELLMPERAEDLRTLMEFSMHRVPWVPLFVLQDFIRVMYNKYRRERIEMLKELLSRKIVDIPVLNQDSLIIWGEKDAVFPLPMAYRLKTHLGEKSRLEIVKDVGHAAQMENYPAVNGLIKRFMLG